MIGFLIAFSPGSGWSGSRRFNHLTRRELSEYPVVSLSHVASRITAILSVASKNDTSVLLDGLSFGSKKQSEKKEARHIPAQLSAEAKRLKGFEAELFSLQKSALQKAQRAQEIWAPRRREAMRSWACSWGPLVFLTERQFNS